MLTLIQCSASLITAKSPSLLSVARRLNITVSSMTKKARVRPQKKREKSWRHLEDILQNEVLYGRSVCNIALRASRRAIFRLHLLARWEGSDPTDSRVLETINLAQQRGIPILYHFREDLDKLSLDRPHQGVCLEVGELPFMDMDNRMESSEVQELNANSLPPLWVLLHGLLDPMNVGAVLRSCLYFAVSGVIVHGSCAPMTPTVSKASSGAAEILPLYRTENASDLIQNLLKNNWDVIGTSSSQLHHSETNPSDDRLEDIHQAKLEKKSLVIFGSEGSGVPDEILDVCTRTVTIRSPEIIENIKDPFSLNDLVGSLNVSTAAAVILYQFRQRGSQR